MRIQRSIEEPIRVGLTWLDLWQGTDVGLIAAWEAGRRFAAAEPQKAGLALKGELISLPWKGGLEPPDPTKPQKSMMGKKAPKYGCLLYLAMWQGVRTEDLSVDATIDTILTCTRNKSAVIYTPDSSKYVSRLE
jgi:hypothetical protein